MRSNWIAAGFALALLPSAAHAKADPFKPGVQDQIKIGRQVSDQLHAKLKMVPETDERLRLIRQIAKNLLKTIPQDELTKNPWAFSFDVVDDKDINAFALPGGPVFFFRGLLNKLSTEDQIAGVLAHEVTHIRKQHWASAYADNQKRQLGIMALLLILRANRNVFDLASITDELVFSLPYSRKHESEADAVGFDMMVRAGYNPAGMTDVFKILMAAPGGKTSEEWASDHPNTAKRIKAIEELTRKINIQFPAQRPLPPSWFLKNIKPRV